MVLDHKYRGGEGVGGIGHPPPTMLSESRVLEHLARQPRQSAGYKQLVREMSLRGEERRLLEEMLASLVRRGRLLQTGRDHYSLPGAAANRNLVIGRLNMHRDGFGFVRPEDDAVRRRLDQDVFIPPPQIGNAMHGDQVLVEVRAQRDGRCEGQIVRIMQRAHQTVVGVFHYGRGSGQRHNYVRPMDERITSDVIIPPGAELPPELLPGEPDRVIGKEARRKAWDDLEGLVVDVEITEWPTATRNPRGRVLEVIGQEDDFGVDVEIVIRKHHLPHRFPLRALAEAQQIEPVIPAHELRARRDFRALPIVTIDGETARDFDDAVHVRRLANGNCELQVHIADVAHYVQPDSPIDLEAQIRGTSVYFPDRAIPMLPVELSTDICSLRPHLDRLVMSCVMEIDREGEISCYGLCPGVIRSAERMTYTAVAAVLSGDAAMRERFRPLTGEFELMQELALILNEKRRRRGSIDFDLPEPVIEFDENGLMQGVSRSVRNMAHRIIEEFMLAANECVAGYLHGRGVATLYRIHEKPEPRRVLEFENVAAGFGYSLGVGAIPVQRFRMKADQRAARGTGKRVRDVELPTDAPITPQMYQKLTAKIAGKPEERILSYLMLRSLMQARYSEVNEGHFALAATDYTHFTSPIRRYPDLIVHRILKAVLGDDPHGGKGGRVVQGRNPRWLAAPSRKGEEKRSPLAGPMSETELHSLAEDCSLAERRADAAERELLEWKQVKFMLGRLGEDFAGMVVSVTKFGLFVELDELFIEGLVPLGTMLDDRYVFHENTRQIIGQRTKKNYSLGDRVRVIVDRVDRNERKIQFALLEEIPQRPRGRRHP